MWKADHFPAVLELPLTGSGGTHPRLSVILKKRWWAVHGGSGGLQPVIGLRLGVWDGEVLCYINIPVRSSYGGISTSSCLQYLLILQQKWQDMSLKKGREISDLWQQMLVPLGSKLVPGTFWRPVAAGHELVELGSSRCQRMRRVGKWIRWWNVSPRFLGFGLFDDLFLNVVHCWVVYSGPVIVLFFFKIVYRWTSILGQQNNEVISNNLVKVGILWHV